MECQVRQSAESSPRPRPRRFAIAQCRRPTMKPKQSLLPDSRVRPLSRRTQSHATFVGDSTSQEPAFGRARDRQFEYAKIGEPLESKLGVAR